MTLSISTQVSPIATILVHQTQANATANVDVLGTHGHVVFIDMDNSANAAPSYLKLYDDGAPIVGTTAPHFILRVPAGQRRIVVCPEGMDFTILSFACVTTPGNGGTTSPASAVNLYITCN